MILVTVELCPLGDMTRKRHLGTAIIANDGTGTAEIGNYTVKLSKWGEPDVAGLRRGRGAWKTGSVAGFRRLTRGPWDLLFQALRETVGARNAKV